MLTKVNKNNKNVNKSVDKLVIMIYIGIALIKVNKFKTNVNYTERREKYLARKRLEVPPRLWKDKNINPEGKKIFAYIYSKGYDRNILHLNVGEIQQELSITNVGLKKHLGILEKYKYLIYNEYSKGMYMIHLLG